jgi:hypothetical protein
MNLTRPILSALLVAALLTTSAAAQRDERPTDVGRDDVVTKPEAAKIAWFGRWNDAREESERTGRPILLMSAAPQCSGTPGMW